MKLTDYFRHFLADTVNLSQTKLSELDGRVDAIDTALNNDPTLGSKILVRVPQGSWAHETIIKPGDGLEFDADFLVQIAEDVDWNLNPKKYAKAVWDCLSQHSTYGSMTTRKNRCVRVTYAESTRCHVDVIPYVVLADGREVIVNRTTNAFEETNPIGFTEWLHHQDKIANRNLRRALRLLKYLRDHQGAFALKSVLLTMLVGQRVESWRTTVDPDYYKDTPTALLHLLEDLDQYLRSYALKPHLVDPSCPATSFDHRWTQVQFETFKTTIAKLREDVSAAYHDPQRDSSVEKWQEIFGASFKQPSLAASASTPLASRSSPPTRGETPDRALHEEFINERVTVNITRTVAITCDVTPATQGNRRERRLALRSRAGRVPPHNDLLFRVVATDVVGDYTTKWKVRNYGADAERHGELRGQIHLDNRGKHERFEKTKYVGRHYVECYVIQNGVCVAWAHDDVIITPN